jgi:magnesium transporter
MILKKTLQHTMKELGSFTRIDKLIPRTAQKGTALDTVRYVGRKREEPVALHVLDYDEEHVTEKDIGSVQECVPFKKSPAVTWLNITGVHDTSAIEEIGKIFSIHPLTLDDIANTTQRPKLEEYDNYLFIIVKMVSFSEKTKEVTIEQVSLIVGKDFVLSFQERQGDVLETLRNRIRNNTGRIRRLGSDYLMYGIIDAIIDHYYVILEQIGEQIEKAETRLLKSPDRYVLTTIYKLKHELIVLRKSIWPTREMVGTLLRTEHGLIDKAIGVYLRDLYDHTIQVVDTVETFRDMTSSMLDLYLSTVSNKMNEVMKVLTIFAAIFIPLTFIVGIYGMNFDYMPELHLTWGYYGVWGVMLSVVMGMIVLFKRKKWL